MPSSMQPFFRLEVSPRPPFAATRTQALAHAIAGLGIRGVSAVRICDLYFLHGGLDAAALERLAQWVLHDPVTEEVRLASTAAGEPPAGQQIVEVALHPGVTDSVADSLLDAARLLGISGLRHAATGQQVILEGTLAPAEVRRIAQELLANGTIQH